MDDLAPAPAAARADGSARPAGRRLTAAAPLCAAGAALAVHAATAAPTIGFGDSPELSAAALSLGVPHPTGYPLLMMLGYAWSTLLAAGDPAWRLNLLSAVFAAVAVGLTAAFVQRLTGRAVAGWVAGGALAFSPTLWAQATLFEVYALHLAFVAGLLLLWLRYEEAPTAARLRVLTFCAGLAATHHLMILLVLLVLAVAVLRHVRRFGRPAELARLAALFVLPFGVLAYLPLAARANPVVNWGDPSTPLRFWSHVTARQYHGNVGGGDASLVEPLVSFAREAVTGLTPGLLALAVAGAAALGLRAWRRPARAGEGLATGRPAALVVLAILGIGVGFGAAYDVVDREPFFLNAALALAALAGAGAGAAVEWTARRRPAATVRVAAACALLPVAPLLAHWGAQDRSADFAAHDHAVGVLQTLPPDAVLLVQGYGGYPAVYASLIEGLRPDVLVVDHFLRIRGDGGGYGPALERLRYTRGLGGDRLILAVTEVAAQSGRPLFVVPAVPDYEWSEIGLARVRRGIVDQLVPAGAGRLPVADAPPQPVARFRAGPTLLAARLRDTHVEAGAPARIELAWSAATDETDAVVRLMAAEPDGTLIEGPEGAPVLAHQHPLGQGVEPAVDGADVRWLESVAVIVPRDLRPGTASLYLALARADAMQPTADGRVFVEIGRVEVQPRVRAAWQLEAGATSPPAGSRMARTAGER